MPPGAGSSSGSSAAVVSPPVIAWPNCSSRSAPGRPGRPGTPGVPSSSPPSSLVPSPTWPSGEKPGLGDGLGRARAGAHHHAGERLVGLLRPRRRADRSSPGPGSRSRRAAAAGRAARRTSSGPRRPGRRARASWRGRASCRSRPRPWCRPSSTSNCGVGRDRDGRLVDLDLHRCRPRRGAVAAERRPRRPRHPRRPTTRGARRPTSAAEATERRIRFMLRLRG